MWLRGLVPTDWYKLPDPPQDVTCELVGVLHSLQGGDNLGSCSWILFLDEFGGKHAAEPILRRAGWGVSVMTKRNGNHVHDFQTLGGVAASRGWSLSDIQPRRPLRLELHCLSLQRPRGDCASGYL